MWLVETDTSTAAAMTEHIVGGECNFHLKAEVTRLGKICP